MSDDHTAEYTPPPKPSDPLIGKTVGEYLVHSVLGRGGMGTVYRAEDTALGIPVALKAIAPAMAADDAFVPDGGGAFAEFYADDGSLAVWYFDDVDGEFVGEAVVWAVAQHDCFGRIAVEADGVAVHLT